MLPLSVAGEWDAVVSTADAAADGMNQDLGVNYSHKNQDVENN